MLWRLSLSVAVVCAIGICDCMKADMMSRLIAPRDYGVKLCGREFIRAVIFTCGGSRWKRSTEGDLDPFQWSSLSGVRAENNQYTWQRGSELTESRPPPFHVSTSNSLADLLALYRGLRDWQQLLGDPSSPETSLQIAVLGEQQDGHTNWMAPSRKKRHLSLGVAGMCCSQGCTKNDIGRLC